jgi:hypothetical protein
MTEDAYSPVRSDNSTLHPAGKMNLRVLSGSGVDSKCDVFLSQSSDVDALRALMRDQPLPPFLDIIGYFDTARFEPLRFLQGNVILGGHGNTGRNFRLCAMPDQTSEFVEFIR